MKYLFLDDCRIPADVKWVNIPRGVDWNIVRSYKEAVNWVLENGFPDFISFDHDLGFDVYDTNENGIIVMTEESTDPSGYDFAKWLIDYDMNNHTMPENFNYSVHSMNNIGAENIRTILRNYLNFRKNGVG